MRAVVIGQDQKAEWDQFVHGSPAAVSWHRYDWSQVLENYYGLRFYPVAACEGSTIRGILPLYQVDTLRTGRTLISIPYVVAGGIVADDDSAQQALLDRLIDLCHETRSARVVLKQYKFRVKGELRTDDGYYNRELGLTPNPDEAWARLNETNRAKIQEAEKQDPVLDYPSPELDRFYELLLKNQHAQGVPCPSQRWVEHLLGTGMYQIALLRVRGLLVAGTLVKKFRETTSFPLTCLPDPREGSQLFAYLLYWKLLARLAKEGIRIFHSGRIPKNGAAPDYRLGWGGVAYDYYYQYYETAPGPGESASKGGRKREVFESVWKRLPKSLARIVGPVIVRQFP